MQDQLPGVFLNFSPCSTPTVSTTGRSIDHIGFEIKNLEAFTQKLEAEASNWMSPTGRCPSLA